MVKMRVILTVLAAGIALLQIPLTKYLAGNWLYAAEGVSAVLFIAAIGVVGFSLFRVDEAPNGELCYDPDNPFWALMLLLWNRDDKPLRSVSLCRAYWSTVLMMSLTIGLLAAAIGFFVVIVPLAISDFLKNPWGNLKEFGATLGIVAAVVAFVGGMVFVSMKVKWLKYLPMVLYLATMAGMLVLGFVVAPFQKIEKTYHVAGWDAAGIYLHHASYIVGGTALAALVIYLAFKYVPALKSTWLGRLLGQFKKQFCPTLTACSNSSYAN